MSLIKAHDQVEVSRAREHLTNVGAYAAFDLDSLGRQMSGCMDPREANVGNRRQPVLMTGPGGEVGDAVDHAIAMTAEQRKLVTIDEALTIDMGLRRTSVHGAHHDCAFIGSLATIIKEEAEPSGFTEWSVKKWIADHELGRLITKDVLDKAKDGAAQQSAYLAETSGGVEHLLHTVDSAFPHHRNVTHMKGEATPHFYIVNGWPNFGLNRHLKHRTQKLRAQAYHDNLTARLSDVYNTHAIPHETRAIRMSALLLRSAATRTVIADAKEKAGYPLEQWEIEIGDNGPVFTEIEPRP